MGVGDLEQLIEELDSSTDDVHREKVLQALAPVLEYHREVLGHVLQVLRQRGQAELISALLQDPIIASALRGYALTDEEHPAASAPQRPPGNSGKLISIETLLASTTRKWVPLLHEHELKEGEFLRVQVFEDEVLVWMSKGQIFACKNRCPQGGGSIAPATSDGSLIVCPCHGYHFDLRSGECVDLPGLKLEILPVEVQSNVVRVAL